MKPHWHPAKTAVFKHAVAGTIETTTERALASQSLLTVLCRVSSKISNRWTNNVPSCNYHCELVHSYNAIIKLLVGYDFYHSHSIYFEICIYIVCANIFCIWEKASAKVTDNSQKVFWVMGEWNRASEEATSLDLWLQGISQG